MQRLIVSGQTRFTLLLVGGLACFAWISGAARPFGGGAESLRGGARQSLVRAAGSGARAQVALTGARRSARARVGAGPRAKASIVGGASASIASFPFQVALYDPRAGSPMAGFFCGGVIIDATHVLTAAHCVTGSGQSAGAADIEVLAGSSSLVASEPSAVHDPVASSTFDSRYNPITSDYDVALLTLAHPLWSGTAPAIDGSDAIAPLPLEPEASPGAANPNRSPAILATASGWGDVNPAPGHAAGYPSALRSVRMPLVADSLCEEQYATIEQSITPRMLCAGGGRSHVDTCYGDSGGPLVVDADTPARPPYDYVLAGLVDFGNGCAQSGYAGVYTRISNPQILGFVNSGIGRASGPVGTLAKHRKHKKRHRHRHKAH